MASTYAIHKGPTGQALEQNDLWIKSSKVMAASDSTVLSNFNSTTGSERSDRRKNKRFQDSSRARIPQNARCIIDQTVSGPLGHFNDGAANLYSHRDFPEVGFSIFPTFCIPQHY